jgi:hypothetical protein
MFDGEVATTELKVPIASVAVLVDAQITNAAAAQAETEEPVQLKCPQLRRFDSSRYPQIGVFDYLERLKKFARFDTALVVALIYIDRLVEADSNFKVTYRNVHRLFLTCATVAEKYYNDIYYCNAFYANVGGINLAEMNRLEVTLLYALMWRLKVSDEEFSAKQRELSLAFENDGLEEMVVVDEAETEKQPADEHSEPSTQASSAQSDSDESMDSYSEDAYPDEAP